MDQIILLKRLGFTEYEARAYLSLAKLGPSTVREIVDDSNLPRNKAYEALQKLENKGKVICVPLSPRKYKVSDAHTLKEEVEKMNSSVDELLEVIEQPKLNEFQELAWVFKGQKKLQEKLASADIKVKKRILTCNHMSHKLFRNQREMRKASDRGVKIKILASFRKENIENYKFYLETGAEIRVMNEELHGKFFPRITILDDKIAKLTIGKPEVSRPEDYLTLWMESKAFAKMLEMYFWNMWNDAKPIEE
ncbi:TrmB family transcriptional regulator, partial [archaeon]|nr:TrmB family transcriptional regulator [archaeon]